MPVGEGEATSAIVKGGWQILPNVLVEENGEESVIDTVRVLIDENPRQSRLFQSSELGHQLCAVGRRVGATQGEIHRHAADAFAPARLALDSTQEGIRGAFENPDVL